MFESIRRSLGRIGARVHFRASRDTVISFAHAFRPDDRVLVLMPFVAPDDRVAMSLLDTIGMRFRQERITIITSGPQVAIVRALPRAVVITFAEDDLSAFFLPRLSLLDRLRGRTFDVAVDLNLDFNLPSGYIGKECRARVRVGFAGPSADLFYNLQVKVDQSAGRDHAYRRLAQCLQMFSGQEGV
jgi:hypothetical protein